jgi:hypothetical protein
MSSDTIEPGTVYIFRLENGLYGACRVIRGPSQVEAQSFAGHHLVCPTWFVGRADEALKHAATKKIMKEARPGFFWVKGAPPSGFKNVGILKIGKEPSRESHHSAPWAMFPNVVYRAWREREQPAAVEAERQRDKAESALAAKKAAAELAARERFNLSGVVPLKRPKAEREPAEVVTGFIAAMHQWEKECARIDKKAQPGASSGMAREALGVVFGEFCTPKERKYGRQGSYSMPPEYDLKNETITDVRLVSPRRAEVEARRASGLDQGLRVYVLLKVKGAWLIDGNKVRDGEPGIL